MASGVSNIANNLLTRRCRVIVCGVGGRMGKIRTELIYANPRFELCGVCDINLEAAQIQADKFSVRLLDVSSTDTNNSLNSTTLDGLVITVPTKYHGDYIKEAAQNGLGVFVEKPVADSPDEIEHLYEICDQHQVPLCCGFQRRFDRSYVQAAHNVQQGNIGKVTNAHIHFGDSPGPSLEFMITGGNIFFDLSVHDVDFIRWALNEEIESVYARGNSSREELLECNIQDNATMMMTTASGCIVTLTMSRRASYGYDQRCEIYAEKGKISVGNEFETTTIISDKHGDHWSRLKNSFDSRFRDAFTNEINTFADTLSGKTTWPVSKNDVIRVEQVAAAAKKSLETNQIVYLENNDSR
ncbi:putative myo-inositol dehydrogenase [Fragilariopsis cylindrus CCMP1102]|uniref:Putative myo-inositol dehydrogenase n=1 Tax=Fragilariopsis cylindrus CCMP1102 TaxID=635003 RepID=A0A1E7FRW5_9STRA|nr:putative myo-inositol dehydrogenase [Fragilariopsis cylindrus CCMP1102]|eukprot:OEU20886.1 putative myo-inositol dehydrogenase [Fragilariopsis cylindrus CCMP1102]